MKKHLYVVNWDRYRQLNAAAADSYEQVYRGILGSLQAKGYTVRVLLREARGNTMDRLWEKEYSVIGGGGTFRRMVEKIFCGSERPLVYESLPKRKDSLSLSEDFLRSWCLPFDSGCGEAARRVIWFSDGEGHAYQLTVNKIPKPPLSPDKSNRVGFTTSVGRDYQCYVECFFSGCSEYDGPKPEALKKQSAEKRAEQMLDPELIKPLMGLRLGDLKLSPNASKPAILLFDKAKISELADQFFSGETAGSMSDSQKRDAMAEMIAFVQNLRRSHRDGVNYNSTSCWSGNLRHTYREWEVSCYDGGNCGTDTATREVSISVLNTAWENCEESCLKSIERRIKRSEEPEETVRRIREGWGYDGNLKNETYPVLPDGYSTLLLKNPFGIKGIIKISFGGRN